MSKAATVSLSVSELTKAYNDVNVVNGVSFSVDQGEVFGILGPNGAGKTTTLEMIEGLRTIGGGEAMVEGIDVSQSPDQVKAIIGIQRQSSDFFDNIRLTEMLQMFAGLYGAKIDAMSLLREVNLESKAKSYVQTLSGGQRQRFSIAAALVNQPKVLFLDEPTTGLDPQARRNLWELVQHVQGKGITVILTTHYMEEAEVLCDRVAIMDEGKIIAIDSPKNLIEQLIDRGFKPKKMVQQATLEDVFIDLTGKALRE